jgi:hypothetical protein
MKYFLILLHRIVIKLRAESVRAPLSLRHRVVFTFLTQFFAQGRRTLTVRDIKESNYKRVPLK